MARLVRLEPSRCLPDGWTAKLKGILLGGSFFDRDLLVGGEDADVYRPDGSLLLAFRHRALPAWVCRRAYPALLRAAQPSANRGTAAGGRRRPVKADGTVSNTLQSEPVRSGIVGYFDRDPPRFPVCRTTAYTARDVKGWHRISPFVLAVNEVFRRGCPERYEAQMRAVRATHPYWVIPGTAFTTVTVNRNFQTSVHKDEGDLAEGFGVMSVIRAGDFAGGLLVFPKYRLAVEMRSRDVLLADVHEYHGNTALVGVEGEYDRISTVLYYRTGMRHCLSPEEEFRHAQGQSPGDPPR